MNYKMRIGKIIVYNEDGMDVVIAIIKIIEIMKKVCQICFE